MYAKMETNTTKYPNLSVSKPKKTISKIIFNKCRKMRNKLYRIHHHDHTSVSNSDDLEDKRLGVYTIGTSQTDWSQSVEVNAAKGFWTLAGFVLLLTCMMLAAGILMTVSFRNQNSLVRFYIWSIPAGEYRDVPQSLSNIYDSVSNETSFNLYNDMEEIEVEESMKNHQVCQNVSSEQCQGKFDDVNPTWNTVQYSSVYTYSAYVINSSVHILGYIAKDGPRLYCNLGYEDKKAVVSERAMIVSYPDNTSTTGYPDRFTMAIFECGVSSVFQQTPAVVSLTSNPCERSPVVYPLTSTASETNNSVQTKTTGACIIDLSDNSAHFEDRMSYFMTDSTNSFMYDKNGLLKLYKSDGYHVSSRLSSSRIPALLDRMISNVSRTKLLVTDCLHRSMLTSPTNVTVVVYLDDDVSLDVLSSWECSTIRIPFELIIYTKTSLDHPYKHIDTRKC